MKKLLLTLTLIFTGVCMAGAQAYLQDPRFGNTPEERDANVKLLNAFQYSYNLKDYTMASQQLKELLQKAPKASENMYIRGVDLYKALVADAKTDAKRQVYLDSMMTLFDLRAENYGDHPTRGRAYVMIQKAMTYNNYAAEGEHEKVNKLFEQAIELTKENIEPADVELIGVYFTNLTNGYKFDEITADQYIERYEGLSTMLSKATSEEAKKVGGDIEAMFAQSGAASCDNIEKIFKPRYDADPTNADLIKKILGLFSRAKCASDFQMHLLEKYYETDPQPEVALMLAGAYEEKKDYEKAFKYINVAIANEKDPALKTSYLLRAAGQTFSIGNFREAASFASRAMEVDPNNGTAAFIYANALLSGINGCSGESRQYACWLVADAFNRALSMMKSDDPQRADAQRAASSLYNNFPKKNDIFMLGLEEGQGYSVSCGWVSGRTTVRGR